MNRLKNHSLCFQIYRYLLMIWVFASGVTNLTVSGQVPYKPVFADPMHESWRYTYFPELDGKGIRSIASKNHTEEYWFGVDSGVIRYDGYHWVSYGHEDGLIGAPVTRVFIDESDHVYAATSHGVFEFSAGKWNGMVYCFGDPKLTITSIYRLESGALLCSSDQGVLLLSSEKNTILTTREKWSALKEKVQMDFVEIPAELLHNEGFDFFSDVFEPEKGKLWLAVTYLLEESGEVLVMFEQDILNGQVTHYDLLSDLADVELGHEQLFFEASNSDVWVVNKGNKKPANRFSKGKWQPMQYGSAFGDDEYSESIAQTSDGRIWISGIGNLYCMRPGADWVKYNSDLSNIPQAHVELYAAGANHLWIYGHQSTVCRVDLSGSTWLTFNNLNFAGEDSHGVSWFLGVEGNVVFHKDEKWLQYTAADGLISDPVRVFIDSKDVPWVIGSDHGVAAAGYLLDGKWVNLQFETLSWGFDYRDIFEATDGSIWLGGSTDIYMEKGQTGGLVQVYGLYDTPEFRMYPSRSNGLDQQNVYGITQSSNGYIWIGGTSLNYFDGNQWRKTKHPDLNDFVNSVHNDDDNHLYVGSRQHGLYLWKGADEWQRFSMDNGLKSNNIISIATSSKGEEIYVATDKDISLYREGRWTNDVLPASHTLSYEGGAIFQGAQNELWINHSPRAWKRRVYSGKAPDDRIKKGFVTYRYRPDEHNPETIIDIYNEEVDNAGNTAIFWSGKHFFNKVHPEDLVYSYRLDAGEWSDFKPITAHTYTGLNDGVHQFEVRAMDVEGNVDPTPATAVFRVIPPVWKQFWFMALIGFFLVTMAFLQFQILKKRQVLRLLNESLQLANDELEGRNHEIQIQKDSLEEAVKKIDQLSQAKVNFFTNITHEFRTPLSLIIGPIEKLSEQEPDDPMVDKLYTIIRKNAIRLQKLINQLLELRRIESGTLELMLEESDLVAFVREVKGLFDNQSREKGIRYSFHSDFQRLTMGFDKDKVEKILFNLLSNAFKYTAEKGCVEVCLEPLNDTHVVLIVSDSGKGMDKESQAKLFERYTTDGLKQHGGYAESSGIGLSYIKDLVEFHQGSIRVESEVGKGTRFLVSLPENLTVPERIIPVTSGTYCIGETLDTSVLPLSLDWRNQSNQENRSEEVVLIVEDNEDMRHFIHLVISSYYEVLMAENGKDALELLNHHDVDLIISDVMMPDMDGVTLCRTIKETPSISHVPVILLTAMSKNEAVIDGYASGADSYLTKPFSPDLLLVRINNLQEAKKRLKKQYAEGIHLSSKEVQLSSFDEKFLTSLSKIIEENACNSQFDVTAMCEMTHLSHMHFIRKVKHLTGHKPAELLKTYRLNQAKHLLSLKKINVSEVGYRVGYDVPNSFARAFKKEFGVSPSEYVMNLSNPVGRV